MSLSSMTGFSRSEGEYENASWAWEIKSVNGKGLDVRCRFPGGYDRLEPIARDAIQKLFRRGNFSVNLALNIRSDEGGYRINWDVLDHILSSLPDVMAKYPNATPPSVDGLMGLRGVIEVADENDSDDRRGALDAELITTMRAALDGLVAARRDEGERLKGFLTDQVSAIQVLYTQAVKLTEKQTDILSNKIKQGVAALLDQSPPLTEERLAQEIAVLFTKADVLEELDRLSAHCDAAKDLLSLDGSIGRKFDFLCQEFNREANTLCSKAIVPELTTIGLELKVVIDQMREQVQNVE